jgi:hypothetical protein
MGGKIEDDIKKMEGDPKKKEDNLSKKNGRRPQAQF